MIPAEDCLICRAVELQPEQPLAVGLCPRLHAAAVDQASTQRQLAERLGTTQCVVTYSEREPVALRADQLAAPADALGVSADLLIGRETWMKGGSGPVGRARSVLETVSRPPRDQQQGIIDVVEALVTHTGGEEHT